LFWSHLILRGCAIGTGLLCSPLRAYSSCAYTSHLLPLQALCFSLFPAGHVTIRAPTHIEDVCAGETRTRPSFFPPAVLPRSSNRSSSFLSSLLVFTGLPANRQYAAFAYVFSPSPPNANFFCSSYSATSAGPVFLFALPPCLRVNAQGRRASCIIAFPPIYSVRLRCRLFLFASRSIFKAYGHFLERPVSSPDSL